MIILEAVRQSNRGQGGFVLDLFPAAAFRKMRYDSRNFKDVQTQIVLTNAILATTTTSKTPSKRTIPETNFSSR